jgi:hypothetical protein
MDIQFWSVERERKIFESMQPYMPELKPTPEFLCYQKHEITRPPMNNRTFRVRRTDIASCVNATLADLGKTMLSLEAQGKTAEDVPWLPYKKCNAIWFDVFHCLGFEYRKSLSVLKTILDPAVVEIPAVFTLTKGHEKPAYAEAIGFAFKDCPDEERKRILDEEIAAILPPDREWVSIDVEPVTTRDEPMLSVRGILQKK